MIAVRWLALALVAVGPDWAAAAEMSGRVVDRGGAPLADAVVFLADGPAAAATTATMDQVDKQFVPSLLVVPVGTAVAFPNRDQIHHHVYSFSPAKPFEIPLYKGEQAPPVVFDRPGAVKLGCNIHDWMAAVILVVPTGVFAVTGADGRFTLRDVPDGPQTALAWHAASQTPVDSTAQRIDAPGGAPLEFALDAAPRRPRRGGGRSYE